MTDDSDDVTLTPWERATVARMEEELDQTDAGPTSPHRRSDRPGPTLFVGAAIAAWGVIVALTGGGFLDLAGWILLAIGLVTVWEHI